jgi:hypothetical protein
MTTPLIQTSFAAGEIAPSLFGHVDLSKYHVAAATMRNMFVSYRGGALSRAGTEYVLNSWTAASSPYPPRIITFQFSNNQGYVLELGNLYMAIYFQGSPIVHSPTAITGISQANPAVVTAPGHPFVTADRCFISGVEGMAPINGRFFTTNYIDANNFSLTMFNGAPVDSTAFPAYVAGGTVSKLLLIATPWLIQDIATLKFDESADVMSFTHPNYPPYDLSRITETNWTLTQTSFESDIAAPIALETGGPTVNPNPSLSPPTLPAAYAYQITAVNAAGQESIASSIIGFTNSVDMSITAGSIVVNWEPVAGAAYYNIYRAPTSYNTNPGNTSEALPVPLGAIFSFVGLSYGTQFVDSNTVPDATQVPPVHKNPFASGPILGATPSATGHGYTTATVTVTTSTGSGAIIVPVITNGNITGYIITNAGENYQSSDFATVTGDGTGAGLNIVIGPTTGNNPSVVAYFQQRRVYANTLNQPDTYFMSKPGLFTNFDSGIPVQPDDAITGTPWAQRVNGIQWMLPEPGGLVTLTGGGAWQVSGPGGSALNPVAITPSGQQATPQMFAGISSSIPPIPIYTDILFVQANGNIVRDMVYNYFTNNYAGQDQTVLSSHLFTVGELKQWAWAEEPYKVVWAIRCDGVLLSFTYLKEQEVYGWARHDTAGSFVSITSVTEPPVDAIYVIALRSSPAGSFYIVERMDNRIWDSSEDPWCVDSAMSVPQTQYNAVLTASALSGAAVLSSETSVFTADMVGSVLRISGGIANIVQFYDTTDVGIVWVVSPPYGIQGF